MAATRKQPSPTRARVGGQKGGTAGDGRYGPPVALRPVAGLGGAAGRGLAGGVQAGGRNAPEGAISDDAAGGG